MCRLKKVKFMINFTVFLIILIIVSSAYAIYRILSDPKVSSRSEEFFAYANEYTKVAEFYYKDHQKYNADILIYSVPVWNDNMDQDIVCYTKGFTHDITISDELRESITKITNPHYLDKQHLEYICVYKGFVSFCNNNRRASCVYSLNNIKPSYIKAPNESKNDIFLKRLCDNWYFVSETY